MISYDNFYKSLKTTSLFPWTKEIADKVQNILQHSPNGDLPRWLDLLEKLPSINPSKIELNSDYIIVGEKEDCSDAQREHLEQLLRQYPSWRKGPYALFGMQIDTEWRSDMKWDRLKTYISSLKNRIVLDVGSGNGYHCWRMSGSGARVVMGIDATLLYPIQFQVLQKYIQSPSVAVLPLGIDDMPKEMNCFDSVFSMGLLYHRRSPFDHLFQLKSFLREGGELILETLIIDGQKGEVLSPGDRYAKMPNVFFIPTVLTLEAWMRRMGFENIRCVDVHQTTSEEQRVTDWFGFQSLADFLDPKDNNKTVEGYPAPKRAIFLANKP